MAIVLNGIVFDTACPLTVKDLLSLKEIDADRVVIEVNYQIIVKKDWETFLIYDNDNVEVLRFVGGG